MSFRRTRPLGSLPSGVRTPTSNQQQQQNSGSSSAKTALESNVSSYSWPGTKISAHSGSQVLVSSGVTSLDDFLGGGLPVGSITMIKEDKLTGYSRLLRNYFVAQGIASDQFICYASADEHNPSSSLRQLMSIVGEEKQKDSSSSSSNVGNVTSSQTQSRRLKPSLRSGMGGSSSISSDKHDSQLKIAWRYKNLPNLASSSGSSTVNSPSFMGHKVPYTSIFDLTKTIEKEVIDTALENQIAIINARTWASHFLTENDILLDGDIKNSHDELKSDNQSIMKQRPYVRLLEHLSQLLAEFRLVNNPKGVLRICISSLASPSWIVGDKSNYHESTELFIFIHSLRMMVRECAAVCMITIPAYIYGDQYPVDVNSSITKLYHACDCVIELESFCGSARTMNKQYEKLYHGLIHILKLPRIGVIQATALLQRPSSGNVELSSLGFNVRRKRFLVETIYLPPEDEDDDIIAEVTFGSDSKPSKTKKNKMKKEKSDEFSGIEISFENSDDNKGNTIGDSESDSESESESESDSDSDSDSEFETVGGHEFGDVEEEPTTSEDEMYGGEDNEDDFSDDESHERKIRKELDQQRRQKTQMSQLLDF